MLHLYRAHDLDTLFDCWSSLAIQPVENGPLSPRTVIVPNMDMAHWLQIKLAEKNGISANIDFQLPAGFFRKIFEVRDPGVRNRLIDKPSLQWMIFTMLGELLSGDGASGERVKNPDLIPLRNWLDRSAQKFKEPLDSQFILWQLSAQIADVFDQYIMYRPDWMTQWSGETLVHMFTGSARHSSKSPELNGNWQPVLWRELYARWPEYHHRAKLMTDFLKLLSSEDKIHEWPASISIFGVQNLSPIMLEAFISGSHKSDVHWFQRVNSGNHFQMDPFFAELNEDEHEFSRLFDDLIDFHSPDVHVHTIEGSDKSLTSAPKVLSTAGATNIHRCHSPRREVEVLKDTLLDLFDTNDIRPGDIAIVTPDPDLYAPFIREVFHDERRGEYTIPVRSVAGWNDERQFVSEIWVKALKLSESRFKVSELVDWLGASPILGDYLDENGLRETLNRWIIDQGIHWGSNEQHVRDQGLEIDSRFTWSHGLGRLMLSRIASESGDFEWNDMLSGSAIITSEESVLLGRLSELIRCLDELRQLRTRSMSPNEWANILSSLTDRLIMDRYWIDKSDRIKSAIRSLTTMEHITGPIQVTLQIITDYLADRLKKRGLGRSWHPGEVTFTGMVALHHIPYKVVAMIGLNDGSLPVRSQGHTFDLMREYPRPGDRIRRKADRQLFFDYLMCTHQKLHLSYTGFRQTDNKPLAPSVLLTALQDVTHRLSSNGSATIIPVVEHRLQPFHTSYFDSKSDRRSFSTRNAEIAASIINKPEKQGTIAEVLTPDLFRNLDVKTMISNLSTPGISSASAHVSSSQDNSGPCKIPVTSLVDFFRDPCKMFLRHGYGLDLFEREVPDEDVEPLNLDALESWYLRNNLIERLRKSDNTFAQTNIKISEHFESIRVDFIRRGKLPYGVAGDIAIQKAINIADVPLSHIAEKSPDARFVDVQVNIPLTLADGNEVIVEGLVSSNTGPIHFEMDVGNSNANKLVRCWIRHLLLNYGQGRQTHMYFKDTKSVVFPAMDPEQVTLRLQNLLYLYLLGNTYLVPIFPLCANEVLNNNKDGPTVSGLRKSVLGIVHAAGQDDERFASDYIKELNNTWCLHAWRDVHPLKGVLDHDVYIPESESGDADRIDLEDFKRYDAFSIYMFKVIRLMNDDKETI